MNYAVPSHGFSKKAKFFECPEASLACPSDKKIVKKKLHRYGKLNLSEKHPPALVPLPTALDNN
jgi:hypothetical protein